MPKRVKCEACHSRLMSHISLQKVYLNIFVAFLLNNCFLCYALVTCCLCRCLCGLLIAIQLYLWGEFKEINSILGLKSYINIFLSHKKVMNFKHSSSNMPSQHQVELNINEKFFKRHPSCPIIINFHSNQAFFHFIQSRIK